MAKLRNLVEQYLDGLDQLSKLVGQGISDYTTSNTTFGNTADKLHQNSQQWNIGIAFQGLGANAFFNAVKANQARAGVLIAKLTDFQVACTNTSKAVDGATATCDDLSNYWLHSWADPYAEDFLLYNAGHYEFVESNILEHLIDTFVKNTTLDRLLNPANAPADIQSGLELGAYELVQIARIRMFQKQQDICNDPQYKEIVSTNPTDIENVQAYKQVTLDYNATCELINELKGRVFNGISTWVVDMQTFTESCLQDYYAASALNMPTLGDMLTLLNTTYKNQSVVIWQTPNGGLLVMVNGSNVSSSQVEADIQQYMLEHKLSNAPITLLGYQGGTQVAQQVVEDLYNDPNKYHFTIPNVVMVGGDIPDRSKDQYAATNYLVYQMLPGEDGKFPSPTAEQWTLMGITAAAGVALTLFTGGVSDEAAVAIDGTELAAIEGEDGAAASVWLNAIKEEAVDLAKEKATEFGADIIYNANNPEATPGLSKTLAGMANNQYSTELSGGLLSHPYVPAGQTPTIDPQTGQPISPTNPNQTINAKLYYDHLMLIPDEDGMNAKTYQNSAFLNRQPLPDPVASANPKSRLGSPPINLPDPTDPNSIPLIGPEAYP